MILKNINARREKKRQKIYDESKSDPLKLIDVGNGIVATKLDISMEEYETMLRVMKTSGLRKFWESLKLKLSKKNIVDSAIQQDITLILPSHKNFSEYLAKNKLDDYYPNEIKKFYGITIYQTAHFEKRSSWEILDYCKTYTKSTFFKFYHKGGEETFVNAIKEFLRYKEDMDQNHFGKFSYHSVQNEEMRNIITNTMKKFDAPFYKESKLMNGKNIFIVDDGVSNVQDMVKTLGEIYIPKSFTILTGFSKKG